LPHSDVTKKNIASGNSKRPRKTRKDSKKLKSKQLDFLSFVDDSVGYSELIPFSNRFHLSAARDTARKVELLSGVRKSNYATESASAINDPNISALMDESLTYLEDPKFLKQFTTNKENRRIIIAENNYDDTTLWRIHDAYRTDGAVSRSLDTMVEAVVGRKRTSLILDTNDYYDNEDDELEALDEIKNNELYRKYVRDISKINKHLNMNTFEKMILTSVLIYGRAAILIEYDKDPLKFKDALPIALKALSSLRIGRVFYYADTWELAGIEYLDFKEDKRIVEPHRLIYYVNKDYHISPRTLHNGYSILEPVLDIAETNTLNRQTNIKEINKRLWAAFVIIKYFGKKKKDVDNFIKNYKAGMPIIGNRDFEVQVEEVAHDLEKLIAQGLDADKKISRDIKIPIMLTGHDNEQAMATAGTVIHSWINFVLESARTDFRNVFEKQWIERLLLALINKNKELDTFLGLIKEDDNTQGYIVSDKENKILNPIDLPFKIKLQFANFTIDTFLDKIAGVKALVDSGIITKIMALTELDRKEYIPEMRKVIEEQELQFQEMMDQEADFKQQELDNKNVNNSKQNPKLPKVDSKAKSQVDINNRKTKSSSAGSNNSLRS
jgi:hypothetical protein